MLSCKDMTRLASERLDRALTLRERIELRFHLTMCAACTRFNAQLQFMRRALSRYANGDRPDRD